MNKLVLLLIITVLGYLAWPSVQPQLSKWTTGRSSDPVEAMQELAAAVPSRIQTERGGVWELKHVKYNVKKTDSLSAPVIGLIYFEERGFTDTTLDYTIVYHWQGGRWMFQSLTCTTLDVNRAAFEYDVMSSPEMRLFLLHGVDAPAAMRRKAAAEAKQAQRAALAEEERKNQEQAERERQIAERQAALHPPTPSPEQIRAEIERKYGAKR